MPTDFGNFNAIVYIIHECEMFVDNDSKEFDIICIFLKLQIEF